MHARSLGRLSRIPSVVRTTLSSASRGGRGAHSGTMRDADNEARRAQVGALAAEEGLAVGPRWWLQTEVSPRLRRRYPPARSAREEPATHQKRLGNLGHGFRLLTDRDSKGRQPDRPTVEAMQQRVEYGVVEPVESAFVDVVERERRSSDGCVDHSVSAYFGVVTHSS